MTSLLQLDIWSVHLLNGLSVADSGLSGYTTNKDGVFVKLKGNNSRCVGSSVCVGPLHKRDAVPEDIVTAALVKFKQDDCRFDDRASYNLMYPDGRPGRMLPDESAPFTLEGYKVFKGIAYRRLRLSLYALHVGWRSVSKVPLLWWPNLPCSLSWEYVLPVSGIMAEKGYTL